MLDEADEMLSKGFKEQIYDVYRYLPPDTQVCRGRTTGTACVEVVAEQGVAGIQGSGCRPGALSCIVSGPRGVPKRCTE